MKKKPQKTRDTAHSFKYRICHWEYCRHCGLVALRNQATEEAIRRPCPGLVDE